MLVCNAGQIPSMHKPTSVPDSISYMAKAHIGKLYTFVVLICVLFFMYLFCMANSVCSPVASPAPPSFGTREKGEGCGVLPVFALVGLVALGAPAPTETLGEKPKYTCSNASVRKPIQIEGLFMLLFNLLRTTAPTTLHAACARFAAC